MLHWMGSKDVNQLIARGQYARAIKLLEQELAADPTSIHLRQRLADVLERDGQKQRAIEVLEGLVQEYSQEGFLTKAIAVVKKVQRIDPEQAEAEDMLDTLMRMKHQNAPAFTPPPIPAPGHKPAATGRPEPASVDDDHAVLKTSTLVLSEIWFDAAADQRKDFNWSPLFRDFSKSELAALVGGLRLLVKQPGSIIFTEGEPGNSLFVLANGRARIYRRDASGHNDQVAVLQEGEIFGIPSILVGAPRTATVTAIDECELLELEKHVLENITETFPRIRELVEELQESRTY
jgi:cAMP-dependent protein kinase regulator